MITMVSVDDDILIYYTSNLKIGLVKLKALAEQVMESGGNAEVKMVDRNLNEGGKYPSIKITPPKDYVGSYVLNELPHLMESARIKW